MDPEMLRKFEALAAEIGGGGPGGLAGKGKKKPSKGADGAAEDAVEDPASLIGSEADTPEARAAYHAQQVDDDLEGARVRHWDHTAWVRGGAPNPGRVMDVDTDATSAGGEAVLAARERALMLAELSIDLPNHMADFAPLRHAGGFSDDGTPMQHLEGLPDPEPLNEDATAEQKATHAAALRLARANRAAAQWIDGVTDLASLLELQDRYPPPSAEEVKARAQLEQDDEEQEALGRALRERYAALVTHTSWLITRLDLLLDSSSAAGWETPAEVRYRFIGEQLHRAQQSALQSMAFFSVHAAALAPLGASACDAMARQCWSQLSYVTSRQSHLTEEALAVLEHLEQWEEDDRDAGLLREAGASEVDVQRELASLHAFCSRWGAAIASEHTYLRGCSSRAGLYALALREGQGQEVPEFGLQHYASEALPSLCRISHALLQFPNEDDVAQQQKQQQQEQQEQQPQEGEESESDQPQYPPHYRDVLAAVHTAQLAVGLVWRQASMLSRDSTYLRTHLAEAQARQEAADAAEKGDGKDDGGQHEEVADRLSLRLAEHGAKQVEKLVAQHAAWPSAEELAPQELLDTALMQSKRTPRLRRGFETFLHFLDRVPGTSETAARGHAWSYAALTARHDAAAAHQQLGLALQAWVEEEKEIVQQRKEKREQRGEVQEGEGEGEQELLSLGHGEQLQLQQCMAVAFEAARKLAAIPPSAAAALRVQDELEGVPQEQIDELIKRVKSGAELPPL
jgi:hypothetical protein